MNLEERKKQLLDLDNEIREKQLLKQDLKKDLQNLCPHEKTTRWFEETYCIECGKHWRR